MLRLAPALIPPTADALADDSARARCSSRLGARSDEIEVEVTS